MYVTNGVIKVKLAENTLEIHEGKDYLLIQTLYMKFVTRMKARVSIAGTLGCPMSRNISILLMLVELLIEAQSIPFIKLIPKGEENVSLLRRIERVGHIYLSQRDYYQLQILSEFYQCLNHLLNIFDRYEQINQYFFDPRVKQCIEYLQSHYHKRCN